MVCGQRNQCDDRFVYRRGEIRLLGALMTLFAIIEFGIGGAIADTFVDSPFNTSSVYWISAFFLTAGTAALSSMNKGLVMIACIAASTGIIAGLSGSVSEAATASIFQHLLSCGRFYKYTYPITVPLNQPGATNVQYFGNPGTFNTTRWCLYQTPEKAYNADSCYCSFYPKPVPINQPSLSESCITLQYAKAGTTCDKIFSSFTPTLKASSAITAMLTILSLLLSVLTCTSLCCEQRNDELPAFPAYINQGGLRGQVTIVQVGPNGQPYYTNSTSINGSMQQPQVQGQATVLEADNQYYADGGKIQQAYYIDANGVPVGLPNSAVAGVASASASASASGHAGTNFNGNANANASANASANANANAGGAWTHPGPTVVAYPVSLSRPSNHGSTSVHGPASE